MDEPPIRVKRGSIIMDVIHDRKQWRKHNNNNRHWKLSSGKRGKNKYLVYLAPTLGNHARCPKGFVHQGDVVEFTHTNPVTNVDVVVTFKSTNKKTSVTSGASLDTPTLSNRRLQYTDTEKTTYISLIKIDGTKVGEFTDKSQLDSVLITEEP
jgi:hypothetical protein